MPPRVLITAELPVDPAAAVPGAEVVRVAPTELASAIAGADAVVCLLSDHIDADLLDRAPRLRVVANVAVGFDNVDVAAATARGVAVANTPDVLTEATADLAFALVLAAARRLGEGERLVRSGRWTGWALDQLLGVDVWGRTLGLVGLGRIGRAVARRGRGFQMDVLYAAPRPAPDADELGATRVPLDELLARADVVSLHCPLTPETRGLIDAAALARMKPTAVLVNTARGGLRRRGRPGRGAGGGPAGRRRARRLRRRAADRPRRCSPSRPRGLGAARRIGYDYGSETDGGAGSRRGARGARRGSPRQPGRSRRSGIGGVGERARRSWS